MINREWTRMNTDTSLTADGRRFTQISVWASTTPLTLICVLLRLDFPFSRPFAVVFPFFEILFRARYGEYLAL